MMTTAPTTETTRRLMNHAGVCCVRALRNAVTTANEQNAHEMQECAIRFMTVAIEKAKALGELADAS